MMEDGAPLYVGGEFGNSGKKPANIDARTFITASDALLVLADFDCSAVPPC